MRLFYSMEHLTDEGDAKRVWREILEAITEVGRQDVLKNLRVLDLGGGASEFSKFLNTQGINCVSLDKKDWGDYPGAKQVRGDVYQMPFPDESFNLVHGRGIFDESLYKHDFGKLFLEIARVLRPGGILSVYDFTPPPKKEVEKYFRLITPPGQEHPTLWKKK